MQIPIGNLNPAEPTPTQSGIVRNPGNPQLQAAAEAGNALVNIGVAAAAENRQAQERADRAATITAEARAQNGLSDLSDQLLAGVSDGTIKSDDARLRWQADSKTMLEQQLGQVPKAYQEILKAQSEGWTGKLSNRLEDGIRARNQQEVGANLSAFGEEMQRFARKDITGATEKFDATIDVLGPQAGLKPEQIQSSKQKFKEQTRYTQAFDLVAQAGDNVGALQTVAKRLNTDEFIDIDPQRRVALDAQVSSKIATLENRAVIRQQAAMNRAQATYTSFSQFMDGGRLPTQEYSQDVLTRVKGTPFEAAVVATLKQAPQMAAFSSTPIQGQAAALQGMVTRLNKEGSTPQLEAEYKKREGVLRATLADIERDPINAALERNVVSEVPPINVGDIATLPQQLAGRQSLVSRVSSWTGQQVSPFTKPEADQLGQTLGALPPAQKATALQTLAKTMPPQQMLALSKQLGEKDANLAIAAVLSGRDSTIGRNVGEVYLKGRQALAEGRVKIDPAKETGTKATIYTELQGAYATQQALDAAASATFAVYAQLRTEGRDSLDSAISMVTGGIKEHNGQKIAKPYGWTDDRFDDYLKTVTPATLGAEKFYVNGVETSGDELSKKLPGARLLPAGEGSYRIQAGADVVRLPTGAPYILNVGKPPSVNLPANNYGDRPDGSQKGSGFLGELKLPNGGVATEYSVQSAAVKVDGRQVDFPTLVPTLTKAERDLMVKDIIPNGKQPPESVMQKAIDHAKKRLASGKRQFADDNEVR